MRAVTLICVALVGTASAQTRPDSSDVRISGRVTYSNGAVVPDATVMVLPDDRSEPSLTVRTDQNGVYAAFVKPGQFELRVIVPGFEGATKRVLATGRAVKAPPITLSVAGPCGASAVPVALRASNDDSKLLTPSVCDLAKEPGRFNGKIVSVRGHILIAFEDFELDHAHCGEDRITDVWLEYGRGPKRQPTIWCCGDITPDDPLRVMQDAAFTSFNHYLSDRFRTTDCLGGVCSPYDVTATLTGRFDTQAAECSDGKSHCPVGGAFGHLGFFCSRLVIESVSDVVAKPVARQ